MMPHRNTVDLPDPLPERDLLLHETNSDVVEEVVCDLLARGMSVPELLASIPTLGEATVRRALQTLSLRRASSDAPTPRRERRVATSGLCQV